MRVLIDQQYHLGHHYAYVRHLLPAVAALADEVIVAVTGIGMRSQEFQTHLAGFSGTVRFDPVHEEANPGLPMGDRLRVHRSLRAAVSSIKPDYILIPSGDAQATAMAGFRWTGRRHVPGSVPTEVGIHFGTGTADADRKTRTRDLLNALNLRLSGATRIHLVNQLFFEQCRKVPGLAGRLSTVPNPTPAATGLSTAESRRRLQIPEDGRYIGLAASMDSRKALPEFLTAFRKATSLRTDRVLLAGWMNGTHQEAIKRDYQDLIKDERLILLNGFLDVTTYQTAVSALDVMCTPYPRFPGLSATLLEGVAAGRPILANAHGWSEAMVRRFGLGWTCDVLNHEAFVSAIRTALDSYPAFRETEAIRRLRLFHTPENFARTWTHGLRSIQNVAGDEPYSWDWVQEAVPARERTR